MEIIIKILSSSFQYKSPNDDDQIISSSNQFIHHDGEIKGNIINYGFLIHLVEFI